MASIELAGVGKRYPDGTEAVKGMDLEVADGEFVIFVGPSGCGKTTALRMIAGLEEISEGELLVDGVLVNDLEPRDRDVAMVFQNYALYPSMSVRENMGFALRVARVPKDQIERRVTRTAQVLDLEPHLDRRPGQLSGGQRQRVAMGRAIVREPKAFLMDEPLSNLDAKLRVQMRAEVARLQRRLGTTTIYVTHDQTEAMTLGDRVVVLRAGQVQQVDSPRMLYERPANRFVAGFIGSPAMNFVPARIKGEELELPFGSVPLGAVALAAPGDGAGQRPELLAGIRPEHFEDAAVAEGNSGLRFEVTPSVIESLGSEQFAHFDADGIEVVARLDAASRARAGEPLDLVMDPAGLQLFDADSEQNLSLEAGVSAVGSS